MVAVSDVAAYLADAGWRPTAEFWRGARIWVGEGAELLVPTRDDLGDNAARIRDVLEVLADVESRPVDEIVRDMALPLADLTSWHQAAAGQPAGLTPLDSGLDAIVGMRTMIVSAARVVLEGPHHRFAGRPPGPVGRLLDRVRLGHSRTTDTGFFLLVPVDDLAGGGLPGRDVTTQVHQAASALAEAALADDVAAFDATVAAGVSAEFCAAVSALAGPGRREPFEIGFRWARGLRSELPARTVSFPQDAGVLIRAAATRLRMLDVSGAAVVVGRVDGLHDDAAGDDRWRIRIRGVVAGGSRRTIWVRLPDQRSYDRAIRAHREGDVVRAEGAFTSRNGRVELSARPGAVEITEHPEPEDDRAR